MNWEPFLVVPDGTRGPAPRPLNTFEGMGDRLRAAAFAEIQAREAFLWAAERFEDAPATLRRTWSALAQAEQRHLDWLLRRMFELGIAVDGRAVSHQLWHSLVACESAREFALYMASAEERGRKAGERFYHALIKTDPITAEIFKKIADEEIAHIAVAYQYYGDPTQTTSPDLAIL